MQININDTNSHLIYLMSAFSTLGAGLKPFFMQDKSPIKTFFRRFDDLFKFLLSKSLSVERDFNNNSFSSLVFGSGKVRK
jgi:hypothetical protein